VIWQWAFGKRPLPYFRLIFRPFTVVVERRLDRAVDLLDALSPAFFLSSALCWLQIVPHTNALHRFFESGEICAVRFCLKCILTVVRLAICHLELLHKRILEVLITVAAVSPLFFAWSHGRLLQELPGHYIQFRNVIIGQCRSGASTSRCRSGSTPSPV
jgi:hypothetical protein